MELSGAQCFCGNPFEADQFIVRCDICNESYHGWCVSMKEYMSSDLEKYHCPRCESIYGPSVMKCRTNGHRHDYSEIDADSKPVQTGTPVFIHELKTRHFPRADGVVKHVRGQQLSLQYLQTNGFDMPIIIDGKDGLDMTIPPPNFSVYDVESYIGGDREMDVIDVMKQTNIRMKLTDFVEYYNDPNRTRILNVISLEFTGTSMSPLIEAPYIARKLDWVNTVWPRDWPEDNELKRPAVEKYCLMGVKDSYTDFHVDFGGTSVWYHVFRGEKVFYLIKPTAANLHLYQQWMCSSTQTETFFGDQADVCYKCVIKQGQTMMIPTGWIHAVFTPVDSLVFGGNFVHSLNIPMQIQIYEMERKMKTPSKFLYPCFETINWFAAKRLLQELKEFNDEEKKCPAYLLRGIKALLSILKQWNTDKDYNTLCRSQIPYTINNQKLLKDLSKEIRHAEKLLMALNPPKPERESKRKRKKPTNKDFVNYDADNPLTNSLLKDTLTKPIVVPLETANIRTPLKLTLPKPATYPYVRTSLYSDEQKMELAKSASKRASTVIRIKIGDKSTPNKMNVYGNFAMDPSVMTRKELTWQQSSVYDFHDGSNESDFGSFKIDETPKKKKAVKTLLNKKRKSEEELNEVVSNRTNGIEELLKASAYALGTGSPKSEVLPSQVTPPVRLPPFGAFSIASTGSDRDSPSTRDAIAGMLSFSEQCYSATPEKPQKAPKVAKQQSWEDDDYLSIENMDKVHQDDDFIYPALDVSDEDEFAFKSKAKREEDEAWNPKARVGPLIPKMNRPAREGAKKTSVEKGLEAAAKRSKETATSAKPYTKKKRKDQPPTVTPSTPQDSERVPEKVVKPSFGSICALSNSNRLKDVRAKLAAPVPVERRSKKGMKTAKQRLGKILKIHKMIH